MSDSYQLERVQRKFLKWHLTFYQLIVLLMTIIQYFSTLICRLDRKVQTNISFLTKQIDGRIDSPILLNKLNFRIPVFNCLDDFPFHIPFGFVNYLRNSNMSLMMRLANKDPSFLLGD
ncbi:unnamed protein product [Macrosiphum euphorbiae]|uniref:Uncharacterized protein n=1 Tax=Macrosiphum euphorbiae TaxID=13131 RepID=A0AAV0XAS3_9HEMI|nr:unnamed protein product [Macrosiphum euphorbiae]